MRHNSTTTPPPDEGTKVCLEAPQDETSVHPGTPDRSQDSLCQDGDNPAQSGPPEHPISPPADQWADSQCCGVCTYFDPTAPRESGEVRCSAPNTAGVLVHESHGGKCTLFIRERSKVVKAPTPPKSPSLDRREALLDLLHRAFVNVANGDDALASLIEDARELFNDEPTDLPWRTLIERTIDRTPLGTKEERAEADRETVEQQLGIIQSQDAKLDEIARLLTGDPDTDAGAAVRELAEILDGDPALPFRAPRPSNPPNLLGRVERTLLDLRMARNEAERWRGQLADAAQRNLDTRYRLRRLAKKVARALAEVPE